MAIRRVAFATLIFILGGATFAIAFAILLRQSERPKAVESVDVDIIPTEELAASLQKRKALERLLQASRKEGGDQPSPTVVVSESPAQFIIQPNRIYDVRFLPGGHFLVRADAGKVLFLIDETTAFCVETFARIRAQRKLQVSTCDNKEARMTANTKAEAPAETTSR